MKVFIFHGTLGSPDINWFRWLETQLTNKGWDVTVPALPTPEQSPALWQEALERQSTDPQSADIMIGHSTGATFALRLLEQDYIKPTKTILVGGVIDKINNEEYDRLNAPFISAPFDWSTIRQNGGKIIAIHGDNDPYILVSQANDLAENLHIGLHLIKNGGHLNGEAGYTAFPKILEFL